MHSYLEIEKRIYFSIHMIDWLIRCTGRHVGSWRILIWSNTHGNTISFFKISKHSIQFWISYEYGNYVIQMKPNCTSFGHSRNCLWQSLTKLMWLIWSWTTTFFVLGGLGFCTSTTKPVSRHRVAHCKNVFRNGTVPIPSTQNRCLMTVAHQPPKYFW